MTDTYRSITQLRLHEVEGTDFEVKTRPVKGASIVIMAPHAGGIELRTGPITQDIAGNDFSSYRFIGKKPGGGNKVLHVTSHNFKERECMKLVRKHDTVVTVHGCEGDGQAVYLGGKDLALIDALESALKKEKFAVFATGHKFPGREEENICNLGRAGKGVQFELTLGLRQGPRMGRFVETVRRVLKNFSTE